RSHGRTTFTYTALVRSHDLIPRSTESRKAARIDTVANRFAPRPISDWRERGAIGRGAKRLATEPVVQAFGRPREAEGGEQQERQDRKSTRLNSSHGKIS